MFGRKQNFNPADAGKYLPLLRAYVKKHYAGPGKPAGDARHSFPAGVQFSAANLADGGRTFDEAGMPVSPEAARKDLSALDSPAMRKYYHSWEKKESVTKTFSSEVTRMVTERYRKASAFYIPAGIDKRTFHKIKTDFLYKPSKNTALKCCLGLQLNLRDAEALLQLAGYALSPSDPADLVVRFCLEKKIWDIACVNYLMDSFDLKDLDGYEPG